MAVRKRENESIDSLIKRFNREVNNAGVLAEIKKREFSMTKSQKRRKKREEAALKRRKYERMQRRFSYRSNNDDFKPGFRKNNGENNGAV